MVFMTQIAPKRRGPPTGHPKWGGRVKGTLNKPDDYFWSQVESRRAEVYGLRKSFYNEIKCLLVGQRPTVPSLVVPNTDPLTEAVLDTVAPELLAAIPVNPVIGLQVRIILKRMAYELQVLVHAMWIKPRKYKRTKL